MIKKIIVVFKTHLDIGFTDFAETVIEKYNQEFIPSAIATGEEFKNTPEGFVWTTGSWLIHNYLRTMPEAKAQRCREAIRAGFLRWHGLPFTMHSEAVGKDLYQYGLSLAKELDAEFGLNTIASKCTDVTGNTIGIVPMLCGAGLKFLHIGVNPACTNPDVPEIFRWRESENNEIIVMYEKDYGLFSEIPGTETALYIAHTGDNLGPQSPTWVADVYKKLHKEFPHAQIKAGTLEDVAVELLKIKDTLPIVTQEIGDTWIHGVGSDPQKNNRFRSLLRLAEHWDEPVKRKVYQHLLLIPEHTWGLDEKTHLNDHENFAKEAFNAVRGQERYLKMERSWQEQRAYLDKAIATLDGLHRTAAEASQQEWKIPYPDLSMYKAVSNAEFHKNGWIIAFDETGAINKLEKDGVPYADEAHRLAVLKYDVYSETEVNAFIDRYATDKPEWALEDLGKIGLSKELDSAKSYSALCDGIYENDEGFLVLIRPQGDANTRFGFPPKAILKVLLTQDKVLFDFAWFDKPALRIPEGLWLGFNPPRPLTQIEKLGRWVDPKDVVSCGNRELHATSGLIDFSGIMLNTIDAPVIAVDRPYLYGFYNQIPACDKGIWVNLFNNQYGTNFPMWYEGDARFRYEMFY